MDQSYGLRGSEQLQASFRHEADDLLTDGLALLLLELDPRNAEVINRVFRAMHTLKGSGASAGFRRLAKFVHHVEDVQRIGSIGGLVT